MNNENNTPENEVDVTPDIFAEVMNSKDEPTVPDEKDDAFDILLNNENHPNVLNTEIDTSTPVMQRPTATRTFAEPEAEPTRTIDTKTILDLQRAEEIENELVKTKGRYIESIDNARIGVTIYGEDNTAPNQTVKSVIFAKQQEPHYIGNGFNTGDGKNSPLDTGEGAQKIEENTSYEDEINDPRSDNFLTCMNSACKYRETCVRYRLQNKRANKGLFFPEQCRLEGTYISTEDTSFTGYDNMSTIEDKVAPTNLGEPE